MNTHRRFFYSILVLTIFLSLLATQSVANHSLGEASPILTEAASGEGAAFTGKVNSVSVNVSSLEQISGPIAAGSEVAAVARGEAELQHQTGEGSTAPRSVDREKDSSAGRGSAAPNAGPTSWEGPSLFVESSSIPPDPITAVGPGHVVVPVNRVINIYDRLGNLESSTQASTWYSGLTYSGSPFDPWIIYDHHSDRWMMLYLASNFTDESWFLLSCSATSDPTGVWYNYALDATLNGSTPTTNWADYDKLGVNEDWIFLTANMFAFGGSFQYSKVRILDKATICSGGAASWWDQWGLENSAGNYSFTLQPAQNYDTGSTQYMINSWNGSGTVIYLWRITNIQLINPGPTFTRVSIGVNSYSFAPDAVQPGGVQALDNIDARLLNAVVRDGSLYTTHSVDCTEACLKYYKISNLDGTPSVDIDVTYGASEFYYFYPSITVDGAGNIGLGFARSSSTEYGSARYTGRKTTDGSTQGSAACFTGVDTYLQTDGYGRNRWGDYSGIGIAPDLSMFYIFNEYAADKDGATGIWHTRICPVFFKQRTPADFDRDADTDITVYHWNPTYGQQWYIKDQGTFSWGNATSIPVPADYDGDGYTDIAVYDGGTWYIKDVGVFNWGDADSVPVPGDYDGDGDADIAVIDFHPSWGLLWYIKDGPTHSWGNAASLPVQADYNGDGVTDIAVYNDGTWYIKDIGVYGWGNALSIPVPGDYDGDGDADLAVYVVESGTGTWYIQGQSTTWWGGSDSIPVPGDYDGDGVRDIAVYNLGTWYVKDVLTETWGGAGDYPIPAPDLDGDGDPY